ncbi:MAG: hypothetical protein A2008_11350 [Candidatus Wallbacteria bacterium GWC2_49_35]|uniref:Uncharacterized protein n=1 Tax=Candidatus Wallbacteria bacterium GWC2_49_35 TaxID=1817813 RepID=A0A1F7WFP8_9BACT|nr:MAG: hypothetical protein A2008_11350 [Candidatus Wallbacteria bacterium GWC2_49_35]HBC75881.1 hypothetical protein [Candidatus Wallbacteria bacterium]
MNIIDSSKTTVLKSGLAALAAAAAFSAVFFYAGAAGAQIKMAPGTLPIEIILKNQQAKPGTPPAGRSGLAAPGMNKAPLLQGIPKLADTGAVMLNLRDAANAAAAAVGAAGAGTAEAAVVPSVPLSYSLPADYAGTFEASIDKLYMKKDELPESITMASVAKMKTNPQLSTTKADFDKIAKEAFRGSITTSNWRVAHTSFYKGKDADDDTVYICVAIEYKREASEQSFKRDIESLKIYLKKETSDEYVLLEKFPFLIVMGSNQTGDYEFSTVKEIASRLKVKLFGAASVEPAPIVYPAEKIETAPAAAGKTGEVNLKKPATATESGTVEVSVNENAPPAGTNAVKPAATKLNAIVEDMKNNTSKDSKNDENITADEITADEQ